LELSLDSRFLQEYKSPAQQARAMSESWAEKNMYCPNCLEPRITRQIANTPVKDFLCPLCLQTYQLKSHKQPFKALIIDGAYHTFSEAVESGTAPNLVLMHYDNSRLRVLDIDLVPRFFLNPSCIIARKPLSTHAKRADWVGCNISLEKLPSDARIEMVRDEKIEEPRKVQAKYRRFVPLFLDKTSRERGWTADVLRCVREVGKTPFTLREVYSFERELQKLHPENRHIQAKIRQQLQVLRDHDVLKFAGAGRYELI
jgi:type II restriction enzyme